MPSVQVKDFETAHKPINILYIEDNLADQRLVKEYLGEFGDTYSIDFVALIADAQMLLKDNIYDIMLVDFFLDDGCGLDFIRDVASTFDAPIILLTGNASRQIDIDAHQAGASAFIAKGEITAPLLERTIRYELERHKTAAELRRNYAELNQIKSQIELQGANIVRLTTHLAYNGRAPHENQPQILGNGSVPFEALVDRSHIGEWCIHPDGSTTRLNSVMREILGIKATHVDEIKAFPQVFDKLDYGRASEEMHKWSSGTQSSFEGILHHAATGEKRWVVFSGTPVVGTTDVVEEIMITAVDITERHLTEESISNLARRDPLTKVLNRLAFQELLPQALANSARQGQKTAVLYVDLDNFKTINDNFGHQAGDQLLVHFAAKLKACTRESDFIGRLGGDEFAVTLNNLESANGVAVVLEHLHSELAKPLWINGHQIDVQASIGIAIYPDNAETPEQLIGNADLALYRVKQGNRGHFEFFDPGMLEQVHLRNRLIQDLKNGIQNQEFVVYYQPIVELVSRKVMGFESLIRWHHPTRGLLAPAKFLDLAEETGLICKIGNWVMRQACQQAKLLKKAGQSLHISVNISARQLHQPDFITNVIQCLNETGIDPADLYLEITETAAIDDINVARDVMRSLRRLGVGVSLDDFGTGYSALFLLKDLPATQVKIDRSFIRNIHQDRTNAAISRYVIELSHTLGMRVVAEGVENIDELKYLEDNFCDDCQGYLFARPMSLTATKRWLKKNA